MPRARLLPGGRRTDRQRTLARPSLAGEVMPGSLPARACWPTARRSSPLRSRYWRSRRPPICNAPSRPAASREARSGARGDTGPQRRRLAEAALLARLGRGQVAPARRRAGDQPALPLGGTRPARHHRRSAAGAAIFAVPALQPFV